MMLIYVSGVAEIAGGLGALVPSVRRIAAWGLIALLVAVFRANIYAAFQGMQIGDFANPQWVLWARLSGQFLFIAWVYLCCLRNGGRGRYAHS